MIHLPVFPDFAPMEKDFRPLLHPHLSLLPDGVSEFTFAGLYLFRAQYRYRVCTAPAPHTPSSHALIISGEKDGEAFFMTPCAAPPGEILDELFRTHVCWKNIPVSVWDGAAETIARHNITVTPDRDNFDYLYRRTDLAELAGKKYHKKRNLVNSFTLAYEARRERLTGERAADALRVLDRWRAGRSGAGDYDAAAEALALAPELNLRGAVWYINGRAAAWCLGESLARGRAFAIHFEKGIDEYKGIYQYMNQDFAASLPVWYRHINREQDLGDEGLRQAKMTYRPAGFVEKYTGRKN
ncbi:MAG: phosphatidylglycerol lysyltransferase domain-containing protein [Spirochaetaceae bacterium]|jgi:hypothetical protein|nr:phosphatidylglycerol lysyltransferase domain-containing protein [Spirochaetaceae bacterium]